jgi:hypothetical protein
VLELRVGDDVPCRFEHGGRPVSSDELETLARSWATRPRRATLMIVGDAPYRCIGFAVYTLQRTGFEKIEMGAALSPPP